RKEKPVISTLFKAGELTDHNSNLMAECLSKDTEFLREAATPNPNRDMVSLNKILISNRSKTKVLISQILLIIKVVMQITTTQAFLLLQILTKIKRQKTICLSNKKCNFES